MLESRFVLEQWHIIVIFFTIIAGLFKAEVVCAVNAFITIIEQRKYRGCNAQLLGPDGSWQQINIESYQQEIPFIRSGGVLVLHKDENGQITQEKFSFENWKAQRIRFSQNG